MLTGTQETGNWNCLPQSRCWGLLESVSYLLVCDLVQQIPVVDLELNFPVFHWAAVSGLLSSQSRSLVLQCLRQGSAVSLGSAQRGLGAPLCYPGKSVISLLSEYGITSQFCSVKRLHTGHDYLSVLKSWCVCSCQNQTHLFPFFSLFFPVWQVRSQIRQPLLSTFQRECSPSSLVSLLMVLLALLLLVFNWWVVFWSIHF